MPISPDDKVQRAIIHFPFAERPVASDLSPDDKVWADGLAAELVHAVTDPLSDAELAAADIDMALWDRAAALLDVFLSAARNETVDLVAVEGDGPMRFYIEALMPGRKWQRVAELLLGDEPNEEAPEARDGT